MMLTDPTPSHRLRPLGPANLLTTCFNSWERKQRPLMLYLGLSLTKQIPTGSPLFPNFPSTESTARQWGQDESLLSSLPEPPGLGNYTILKHGPYILEPWVQI